MEENPLIEAAKYRIERTISVVGNEAGADELVANMLERKEDDLGRPIWTWSPSLIEIMGTDYWGTSYKDWLILADIARTLKNRRYGVQLMFIAAVALKRHSNLSLSWLKWTSSEEGIAAANAVACGAMEAIKDALEILQDSDDVQSKNRMMPSLEEMRTTLDRQLRAAKALGPEFKFLTAARKFLRIGNKSIIEILETESEVKTKINEVLDFMVETSNNNVDPDSEEFKNKLEKLRDGIREVCTRFAITIPQ